MREFAPKKFSREQSNTPYSILQSCQQKIDPAKLGLAASDTWSFRTVKDGWPQFDVAGRAKIFSAVCFIKILGSSAFRQHCRQNMRRDVLTVLSTAKYMQYSISLVGERMCYLGCVIHSYHPCQHISAVWNPLQNEGLYSRNLVAQRLPSTHLNLG